MADMLYQAIHTGMLLAVALLIWGPMLALAGLLVWGLIELVRGAD